jgi:arylsulfatase A-like enzyme
MLNRSTLAVLIVVALLCVLGLWVARRGGGDGPRLVVMEGDSLDLIPHLLRAGGSPRLEAGEAREVFALRFDSAEKIGGFRSEQHVERIRSDGERLCYDITAFENRITWDCDLDAGEITHLEVIGLEVERGDGPTLIAWQGPDDAPETWHTLPLSIRTSRRPHDLRIALEDSDRWRGPITRMGLTFCMPSLRTENEPAPVAIGGLRYLQMDLGTRLAIEGQPLSIRRAAIESESRRVVHAPSPSEYPLFVEIPPGAKLDFAIGAFPSTYHQPGDGLCFRILFTEEGEEREESLYSRTLQVRTRQEDRRWFDESIDLSALAGRRGVLSFETTVDGPAGAGDALWAHPILHGPRDERGPMNLIWIVLDTVRADHLGCYGYERETSPNLDAFARRGILFERAFSQAPETVASQMSFLTSLYPSVHGISHAAESKVLHEEVPTLAGVLRSHDHAFATAAFTEGGSMTYRIGFGRGFDRYHDGGYVTERPGKMIEKTFGNAIDWITRNRNRRFFAFLQTYEAHTPYNPPKPYDNLFSPDYQGPHHPPISWLSVERYLLDRQLRHDDRAVVDRLVSIYDGGIRYADHQLGLLLDQIESLDLLENTLIVVTSDHGEEFFDHLAVATHGTSLYEEMMHVPLVLFLPGREPDRIDDPVGLIDIMPTLLEELGVPLPGGLQGRSFLPRLDGHPMEERPIFMEDLTGIIRFGVRYRGIKRILSPRIRENRLYRTFEEYREELGLDRFTGILEEEEVYDLRNDPGERNNLLHEGGEDREEYQASALSEWLRYLEETRRETQSGTEIDSSRFEALRALGYVDDER